MELNEYKQKLLLILIISKFKISCPCLLTLISRICIILTHPWGAPECPKGVFHAFLANATGTASSWPNLLARPHSSVTRSEAVLCDPLLDSGLAAQFPVLLCRRSAWGSLAWKVPQPGSGDSLRLRVWSPRWSLTWVAETKRGRLRRSSSNALLKVKGRRPWVMLVGHILELWKPYDPASISVKTKRLTADSTLPRSFGAVQTVHTLFWAKLLKQSLKTLLLSVLSCCPCHWMLVLLSYEEQTLFPFYLSQCFQF